MPDALKRAIAASVHSAFAFSAADITNDLPTGPVMVVAPHPDDETLGCGAFVARVREAGTEVYIVVVTNGAHSTGSCHLTPAELSELRRQEMANAAARLGVTAEHVRTLDYTDGDTCNKVDQIADDLAAIVRDIQPVLCLSPFRIDAHPDHIATSKAIIALRHRGVLTCPVYEYPIWIWTPRLIARSLAWAASGRAVKVSTEGFLEKKRAALDEHRSQFENITGEIDWKSLPQGFKDRYIKTCEIFFRMCLPLIYHSPLMDAPLVL